MILTGSSNHMARFGRGGLVLHGLDISDDTIRAKTPSVFATAPHNSRSERFQHIPTTDLLASMRSNNFALTEVRQGGSKDEEKRGYTKHLLRFRQRDAQALTVKGDTVPEVIIINAHDGTSSYQIMSGLFRMVCSNGLIVCDNMEGERIAHKGNNVIDNVIEASYRVVTEAESKQPLIEDMRNITLDPSEVAMFGHSAALLRFDEENVNADTVRNVTRVRRDEDNAPNLWNVFNRTQENLTHGGFRNVSFDANGRESRRRAREVNGIDNNVKLNRSLWLLAQGMAKLKHANA